MRNTVALIAGAVTLLLHTYGAVALLFLLLALQLLLLIYEAYRSRQHLATLMEPWLRQLVVYVALLVLSALAAQYTHLPSVQPLAALLATAVASAILRQIQGWANLPPLITGLHQVSPPQGPPGGTR